MCQQRDWVSQISSWRWGDRTKYLVQRASKPKQRKDKFGLCPVCQTGQAGFLWCGSAREPGPMKTGQAGFAGYSKSNLFSNRFWIHFRHEKLRDWLLNMFPTGIRPPPLYKWEDHSRLRNPTSNCQKTHLLPFCPNSFYPCCSSRLSTRFVGVLCGLADPRTISLCSSPTGLPGGCSGASTEWRTDVESA